jgi:hypothetical protein
VKLNNRKSKVKIFKTFNIVKGYLFNLFVSSISINTLN